MKQYVKFICMPMTLFSSDLTSDEKIVMMAIDLHSDSTGASIGTQTISSICGLPQKNVKIALKSLYDKGLIETIVGTEGERKILAKIYKEDYSKSSHRPELLEGTKPQDAETLDYDYIQEQWNTICEHQPKLSRFTPQRKRKIKSALKGADITVADLIKAFKIINSVQFFHSNERNWIATFDWVANAQSLTKILEGVYSKSYQEKREYDNIIKGGDINQQNQDDFYR